MALITLTPSDGSPAIYVNEFNMTRVTPYSDPTLPSANADVVFVGPSAFLGDQQSVVVDETVAAIQGDSAALSAGNLATVTIGGASVVINLNNIISLVAEGTGSKIQYKEFGVVSYLFTTEDPAAITLLF